MRLHAANANLRSAPPMTTGRIAAAGVLVLFDLAIIIAFSLPGVPAGVVNVFWLASWIYALLLAGAALDAAFDVDVAARQGLNSAAYADVMTRRPMPPLALSSIAGGMIFSLAFVSGHCAGFYVMGAIYMFTAVLCAALTLLRLSYHASAGL